MPKKTKLAKGRQDKYYYLAKEQGFRSRAAFKLIQMNKKYDFLSGAKCVVDLCAAPGGWLQVCAKYMPVASIKIGVDLDPIPAIKGCVTFQADITTPRCMALIKKELKHFKADIVLNDGAPNVGANWNTDAYQQVELSLYALKVASETLRRGGMFITKVFRSRDYNALLYVANQLFNKVESNKPQSSRAASAEIFMICQGFKAPDVIDPRLLDPKFALEQVDEVEDSSEKITSLKKLLNTKQNRDGFADDAKANLYTECDLVDFIGSADPHSYLSSFNKFTISDEAREMIKDIKVPKDLDVICEDLKLCGRKEFSDLLKVRYTYNVQKVRKQKEEKDSKIQEEGTTELTMEEIEAQVDKELEQTLQRVEREKKRQLKKERLRDSKQDMRTKMSVIAATSINADEELQLDRKTWDKLKAIEPEEIEQYLPARGPDSDEENMNQNPIERKFDFLTDGAAPQDVSDDSISEDERVTHVDCMANEIQDQLNSTKEYKMLKDKKQVKKELKSKALVELQRQKRMDESDDEKLHNDDVNVGEDGADAESESENDNDLVEERNQRLLAKLKAHKLKTGVKDEADNESGSDDASAQEEEKQMFLNPLLAFKKGKKGAAGSGSEESEEWSDDDKYEPKETREQKKAKKEKERKLLGKRKREGIEGDIDDVKDFFANTAVEEVPANDLSKKGPNDLPDGYSSMDSDEIAETRALAKQMLRKKFRTETIDASYSRYATEENEAILPEWFVEDEAKHHVPNVNLTKEQIDEEKAQLREWNARPSKKVTEAKARKKLRLAKAMNKIKNKAQVVANQDISEGSKMRQIQKMYNKEKAKHKEEKSYVVNRSFNSSQGKKVGRNVKMVDSRMRADSRNSKLKKKSKGGAGNRRGQKGTK